jgi:hypothetical protein
MDQEAISVASATLPDEHLQSAPAGSSGQAAAPNQAAAPASVDQSAASAPAQDPPAGGDKPQSTDAQPQEPAPKKGGLQTRIDELTRQRYEAAREAEYWRQQAQAKASAQPPADKPAPKIEDFQDINAFFQARDAWVEERAVARWRSEQEQAAQTQQARQQQDQRAIAAQQTVERFTAQEADALTRYPDYLAVVQGPAMQQFKQARPDVAQVVIDSPHGPDIVYFLGKNPAQAQQIAALAPIAAAREIGRIEQMFMQPKGQSTNAPPPVRTVGNNAGAQRDPATMGNKEYREWRQSQSKRR